MPAFNSYLSDLKISILHKLHFVILVTMLVFVTENVSAQNFNIEKIHCRLSKEDAASIEKIARYEAAFYNAVFDTQKNDSLKINVHVFGRKQDFKLTPDGENVLHVASDGYYMENTGDVFVLKTEHVNAALLHELSHAFLHHNLRNSPQWFDEGMATYFGSLVVEKDQIFYTPVTGRIERIREMNEKGELHLADFLNNKKRWFGTINTVTDQYTIAYSLIYFLVKTNLNLVKHLADELKNGQPAIVTLSNDFGGFEFFQSKYISFYKQQN
ncbi:MAG: DUF1570 domain-containing protein [Sphingobacteriaceae bacterium]|nr:MAG: DUF1570 domain-containing protein [Sphingobacteriaceae bacterium]